MKSILNFFRKLFGKHKDVRDIVIGNTIPDEIVPTVLPDPPDIIIPTVIPPPVIPSVSLPSIPKPKMINKDYFYKAVREQKLFTTLTQKQVDSLDTILNEWDLKGYADLRWLAYMFATVYRETSKTMLPIEEYGKGAGHKYGKKIDIDGKWYTTPDKLFYGRGFVQLTWKANYDKFGKLLGIDLLNYPEKSMEPKVATDILFIGMTEGLFTGVGLKRYFNSTMEDWTNARKIINGTDKAELIASYGRLFLRCLKFT
jgi:putative chitinase